MTPAQKRVYLNSVYILLISIGGANAYTRGSFVEDHLDEENPCDEWRFGGHLGNGGKYRGITNKVDCYPEDETPKRRAIVNILNAALEMLDLTHKTLAVS